MPSPVLGIDLGTTNSVVAHADETRVRVLRDRDGHLLTPSTVAFAATGEVAVGHAARERRTVDAAHTVFSVKRLIGRPYRSPEVRRAAERLPFKLEEGPTGAAAVRMWDDTFSLPEISAFILRHMREIAESALGQPCANAVITVPANFNELQRMATRDAGRIAGLNVLRILNEPTAAALAYGYRARQSQRIAVYDFGGGTFDISILELSGDVIEVVATAGDTQLGGDDIDRAIADRMLAQFQQQQRVDPQRHVQPYERLTLAAEWIKCQLSEREVAEATIKRLQVADGSTRDLKFQLSRTEFRELCTPLVERTFTICEDALRLAGIRPTQLDAVLLVGGQTRTPRVRELVQDFFGMAPKSSVDPDLAVAHGAALQAYALSGVPAAELARHGRSTRRSSSPEADTARPKPGGGSLYDELTELSAQQSDHTYEEPTNLSRRPRGPLPAGQLPSLRPERSSLSHATTLSGVGDPSSDRPSASDAVTVTSDVRPSLDAVPSRPRDPLRETLELRPAGLRLGAARASSPPRAEEPGYFVSRARVDTRPLPMLTPAPDADDADLPSVLRNSEVSVEVEEPEEDPTTTLLDSPRAKERVAARSERPSAPSKPSRLATARYLGSQGQLERALTLYAELLTERPNDPELLGEARALRAQLGAAGLAPETARRVSAKPPPPPPLRRSQRALERDLVEGGQLGVPATGVSQLLAATYPAGSALPPPSASLAPPALPSDATLASHFPAPPSVAPVLLDVTPHTLCVETTGGFCERIIERNAAIPTEQTRIFTTSRDNQTTVSVRVCQGESRSTEDNQVLGQIELLDLRSGRSGEVSIAVTFVIDADGTLSVRAIDEGTGRGQELRVSLTGAIDAVELERMRKKAQVMAS